MRSKYGCEVITGKSDAGDAMARARALRQELVQNSREAEVL